MKLVEFGVMEAREEATDYANFYGMSSVNSVLSCHFEPIDSDLYLACHFERSEKSFNG